MNILRLTQISDAEDHLRVEISVEGDALARQTATAAFTFELTPQDREDLRWYLEEYLQFPYDPAPTIAARIEGRMSELGVRLFCDVFQSSEDARDLWAQLRPKLDDTRVEVVTSVAEATSIPWELIRDPKTDTPLALRAKAFVRAQPQASQWPQLPQAESGPIRILLVICRPAGDQDVPFRSVASQLVKGLGDAPRNEFQLDVLRPPTFAQMSRVLRQAKADGRPYHVVHFDGHGMYAEVPDTSDIVSWLRELIPVVLSGPRTGKHGFLLFENSHHPSNMEAIDGPSLGRLLVESNVPVLVLNACRSAHAEAPTIPEEISREAETRLEALDDVHTQVRAFGSLAQEVMDAGVAGVVAMRHNVYVVTAAQFVRDLYGTLARGYSLGEAVSMGRKQLAAQPHRAISVTPRPLQDWCVPIVYEAARLRLFSKSDPADVSVDVHAKSTAGAVGASVDTRLPKAPDIGFFGRDETLLALDRAFDCSPIVLLHGYAGIGKTTTAAEFGRWYSLTGGVTGPVLFTSFRQFSPLSRVLDRVGDAFAQVLEQNELNWVALDDAQRRDVALKVFERIPILWIWDNVESVTGFPTGSESAWSDAQQCELADFLRDAAQTKAKFLLTSRRDERGWLGDTLPRRITLPPMPMLERLQLTRALAERHGRQPTEVDDWRPLLRFTAGNPLTIMILIAQALRDGLKTSDQIDTFVEELRRGEAEFDDDSERRLGASLRYGFEHAFDERELKQLAVLYLFNEAVEAQLICHMGDASEPYCLPDLSGITSQEAVALLERAAEVGLLTPVEAVTPEVRGQCYHLHPAIPWFLRSVALKHRLDEDLKATRAFVGAMSFCARSMVQWCTTGHPDGLYTLMFYEANLLGALHFALRHTWIDRVVALAEGLTLLYIHMSRWAELSRLVSRLLSHACDAPEAPPRTGWEDVWTCALTERSRLLVRSGDASEAERLQLRLVQVERESARSALMTADPCADIAAENRIRQLAGALDGLAVAQRETDWKAASESSKEAIALAQRIRDANLEGRCWITLGVTQFARGMDLDAAEASFREALPLFPSTNALDRSKVLYELGLLEMWHYSRAAAGDAPTELREHLGRARGHFEEALALTPEYATDSLAHRHHGLSTVYWEFGDTVAAMFHGQRAIQYDELSGDAGRAAVHRLEFALALRASKRLAHARDYARAAKRGLAEWRTRPDMASVAQQLIDEIEVELADASAGLRFVGQYRLGYEPIVSREQVVDTVKHFDDEQYLCRGHQVSRGQSVCALFAKDFGTREAHQYTVLVLRFDQADPKEVGAALRVYKADVPHSSASRPVDVLKAFLDIYGTELTIGGSGQYRLAQDVEVPVPHWVRDGRDADAFLMSTIRGACDADLLGWIDVAVMTQYVPSERKVCIEIAFAVDRHKYVTSLRRHKVNAPLDPRPGVQ